MNPIGAVKRETNGVPLPTSIFVAEAHNRQVVFCLLGTPRGMVSTLMKNKDRPTTWAKVATLEEWLELIPASHEISRVIIAKNPGNPQGGSHVFNSREETLESGIKIRCRGTLYPKVTIPQNLC